MTARELKDHILNYMTAEEALERLIASTVENLNEEEESFDERIYLEEDQESELDETDVEVPNYNSPYFEIIAAAKKLGWDIAIERDKDFVRGISIGTAEYLDENIKQTT
jgi:hypothetical protein